MTATPATRPALGNLSAPSHARPPRGAGAVGGAGALRRLPARDTEPPFDDELAAGDAPQEQRDVAGQGALMLAFALPSGLLAVPELPEAVRLELLRPVPRLRLVRPEATGQPAADRRRRSQRYPDDEFGPQQTSRVLLPEPRAWAGRLVQAIVEVTAGVRPLAQLVRWTTTDVYDAVQCRVNEAAHNPRPTRARRLSEVVRSVHLSEPADGVAEVCAIVQQGPRCRAIALRLEGVDGRWQCTALQLG